MKERNMARWAVEVAAKQHENDSEAARLLAEARDLGETGLKTARVSRMYWIEAEGSGRQEAQTLAESLLADAVLDLYSVNADALAFPDAANGWIVEIRHKPGVADPVSETVVKAAADLGALPPLHAETGRKAYLVGPLNETQARSLIERLLMNAVIQTYELRHLRAAKG